MELKQFFLHLQHHYFLILLNGQFTLFNKSDVYPCHPPSIFAIIFFPVTERANLTAYIVASVPDVT